MTDNTVTSRCNALRRLHAHLNKPLTNVTADDLVTWQLLRRLAPRTMVSEVSHITCFYDWAVDIGAMDQNPARSLIRPKLNRPLPRPIAEADLALAIAGAPSRIRPWLVLAAYEGLRAMEIASLCREQIHDRSKPPILHVVGKGRVERTVPLCKTALTELRRHGLPSRGFVFPRADGRPGPNTAQRISALSNRYLHGAGIRDTLHSLRHRFGSQLYQKSRDIRLVQDLMGHADPATTAGYAAWDRTTAARFVGQL